MMTSAEAPVSSEEFERLRPFLFGIAYRMTGSAADAEDLVQDAWIRGLRAGEAINSPRAYYTTVVTRLALDYLRSARVTRTTYSGEWLPEPLVDRATSGDPEPVVGGRETLSFAVLTLLEQLSPVERAVFVLHEAFDYRHQEIADLLEIEVATSRQHLTRAKRHLKQRRPRFGSDREAHNRLLQRFLEAATRGDVESLTSLLTADAFAVSDGGGKVAAAVNRVSGADRVARLVAGLAKKNPPERMEIADINGVPGILTYQRGRVDNVLVMDVTPEGQVSALYVQRNPDKLRRIAEAEDRD